MVDRTCGACCKRFKYPAHLRDHLSRKTPCAPILDLTDLSDAIRGDPALDKKKCRFCGRVFSSYTSMCRHVRDSCMIAPNSKNGSTGMEVLYTHTVRKQACEIASLRARNAEIHEGLMAMMRKITAQPTEPGGASHGRCINIDNSIHFHLHQHGQETLDHITPAHIRVILDESISPATDDVKAAARSAVLKTAMLVYSDPDHPENLTCYLPNKKTSDVLVHTGGATGWEVQPAALVLPPMAKKTVDTLFSKQPYEDADGYGPLMKELVENERRYTAGKELRPILIRNKDLLARVLKSLPLSIRADGP